MAVTTIPIEVGADQYLPNWPYPFRDWPGGAMFRGNNYYDETSSVKAIVIYMHGAGQNGIITGPLVDQLVADGNLVFSMNYLGFAPSDRDPYRFNFGSNYDPEVFARHCRLTAWAYASVAHALSIADLPVVVIGQSMGAAGSLFLAAYDWLDPSTNYAYPTKLLESHARHSNLKGFLLNGVTAGGATNKQWNDADRVLNTITMAAASNQYKTILSYGDLDDLASPDFVKRIQTSLPTTSNTYVMSAGARGHNWMNTPDGAAIAVNWVNQIIAGGDILTLGSEVAVAGPKGQPA